MVIEAHALRRTFADVTALGGVDLRVDAGESVAVLGTNGAGKSTLLRLCATSLHPTSGSLRLFGKDSREEARAARKNIGFLSHQSFLYPDLTPLENLLFYAQMFAVPDARVRVAELIEQVGLTSRASRPVRTLSKGLEQRCALARALVHRPRLLLLDEPFTGLDAQAAAMLSQTLRDEHARGTSVLMATHDLERAADLCTRAVVLQAGVARAAIAIERGDVALLQAAYDAALSDVARARREKRA